MVTLMIVFMMIKVTIKILKKLIENDEYGYAIYGRFHCEYWDEDVIYCILERG